MNSRPASQDAAPTDTATHAVPATEKSAHEMDGPAGIRMTGGDLTPHQNAGAVLENATDQRRGEQRMEARQMAGVVQQQTQAHNPSASNPEGLPNPVPGHLIENAE
jgi:hypothetical protein